MNHSSAERRTKPRAETRRAAEATAFLLMFRNYASAVLREATHQGVTPLAASAA